LVALSDRSDHEHFAERDALVTPACCVAALDNLSRNLTMSSQTFSTPRRWIASLALIGAVLGTGVLLAAWKHNANRDAEAASANQPEPIEVVTLATAEPRQHQQATTAVGTVLALRSITLKNEVPGTVQRVSLTPGQVVEAGAVLVMLDVSVEQADLRALEAQAKLAETTLGRLERLVERGAVAQDQVDQARTQRDVALAQTERLRALIAKKTIRAPFHARVGLANVHPGQYLNAGEELTTLQGVSEEAHVDFAVAQSVAAGLRVGSTVKVSTGEGTTPLVARIVAIDARVDSTTRNTTIRARLAANAQSPSPGASVRVLVPVGVSSAAVAIPVSALRKGPDGDHVWVIAPDSAGVPRAHERMVQSGPVLDDTVILLGGLTAGEQVAATGSFKLREAVRVQPAATVAASPNAL
jgi:membrane fusion protein, multidrug efflux system